MIKALENPHFKKIWEEVNWKVRHSEAESLEEALVWESNINEALVATGCGTIYRCEDVEFCEENPYSVGINPKNNIKIKNEYNREGGYQCIILGRPITLEDILMLLGKNTRQANEIGIVMLENGNLYIKPQTSGKYDFEWEYSKLLHEQTPETWEKVSKSIK